jgi:hypothetical protein
MDDLQQIVNIISPGSVPVSGSNSTNNITLPISATDVTWFDQNNGDIHSVQQALQTTNTRVSFLESGSGSNSNSSSSSITLPLSAADVNCIGSDSLTTTLQLQLNSLYQSQSNPNNQITLPLSAEHVSCLDVDEQIIDLQSQLNSVY